MRLDDPGALLKHRIDIICTTCPGPGLGAGESKRRRHGGESEQCETLHDRSIPFGRCKSSPQMLL